MNRAIDRVLWPSLFAATLLFVGWGMVPRAPLFTTVLSPARLIAVAALVKLTLLSLGALWSWRARASIEADIGSCEIVSCQVPPPYRTCNTSCRCTP